MKKKIIRVAAVVLTIWLAVFTVDYVRCMDLEKPMFAVASTMDDGGSGTYYGLGYRVEMEGFLDANHGYMVESAEFWLFGLFLIGAAIT